MEQPKPKFRVNDVCYRFCNKGIEKSKIKKIQKVVDKDDNFLKYQYDAGFKDMGYMDGFYAPCSLWNNEKELFASVNELQEVIQDAVTGA